MTAKLSRELQLVMESLAALIEARDEKEANSERYHELKRNAWGNARISLSALPGLIRQARAMERLKD